LLSESMPPQSQHLCVNDSITRRNKNYKNASSDTVVLWFARYLFPADVGRKFGYNTSNINMTSNWILLCCSSCSIAHDIDDNNNYRLWLSDTLNKITKDPQKVFHLISISIFKD
jgi:hypothetical protein